MPVPGAGEVLDVRTIVLKNGAGICNDRRFEVGKVLNLCGSQVQIERLRIKPWEPKNNNYMSSIISITFGLVGEPDIVAFVNVDLLEGMVLA